MRHHLIRLLGIAGVLVAALGLGCGGDHDHGSHDHDPGAEETAAEVEKALAELGPEDRKLAEAQKICPVSEEALGSMGTPIKIDVKGQPVFICCAACRKRLLAKPDHYLGKLGKKAG